MAQQQPKLTKQDNFYFRLKESIIAFQNLSQKLYILALKNIYLSSEVYASVRKYTHNPNYFLAGENFLETLQICGLKSRNG